MFHCVFVSLSLAPPIAAQKIPTGWVCNMETDVLLSPGWCRSCRSTSNKCSVWPPFKRRERTVLTSALATVYLTWRSAKHTRHKEQRLAQCFVGQAASWSAVIPPACSGAGQTYPCQCRPLLAEQLKCGRQLLYPRLKHKKNKANFMVKLQVLLDIIHNVLNITCKSSQILIVLRQQWKHKLSLAVKYD